MRRATLAVFFFVACSDTRSPGKVCDRIASLVKTNDVPALTHDACVEQLEEMKSSDAKAYECTADCVFSVTDGGAAAACLAKCEKH